MSEKRKKCAACCLKLKAKSVKVELFEATEWEDGEPGCVRVRIDGRWHNAPEGSRLWLDVENVGALVARLLMDDGSLPEPRAVPERPNVSRAQLVSMPCGPYTRRGEPLGTALGRIASEDALLGCDGRWYVIVSGGIEPLHFVAHDDLTFPPERKSGRK
ncbi:MAG: hypothetical protein J5828_06155 [Desulfovibrionaceae bacterium]|nr:hypothetical protein [Desulfovibrionaceae bacterium]